MSSDKSADRAHWQLKIAQLQTRINEASLIYHYVSRFDLVHVSKINVVSTARRGEDNELRQVKAECSEDKD
jgi:hypothetical protein